MVTFVSVVMADRKGEEEEYDTVQKLATKYPILYRIKAKPNDTRHCAHSVGFFTTRKAAKARIPYRGTSHDGDDNVTWSYSVTIVETNQLTSMPELNTVPSHFPYTGW